MAALRVVYGFRVKLGRFEEWRALVRQADELVARHGGPNLRSYMAVATGSHSRCYCTLEFADSARWGAFVDSAVLDPEMRSFTEKLAGRPDSPAQVLSTALLSEIPLGDSDSVRGPVVEVTVSQVIAGRLDEAVAAATQGMPTHRARGATDVRLFAVGPAGSDSNRLVWTAEYPSFATFGHQHDQLNTIRWMGSASSPFETDSYRHDLYAEIRP